MVPYIDDHIGVNSSKESGFTQVISPKGVCRSDRYAQDLTPGGVHFEVPAGVDMDSWSHYDSPSMPVRGMGIGFCGNFEKNYGDRVAPEGQ